MTKTNFFTKYKHEFKAALAMVASAVLYSISITAFIQNSPLLTGGVAGIALIIARQFFPNYESIAFSIFYLIINIPLFVLAFKNLGKVFAIFSALNVILASVLISITPPDFFSFIDLGDEILTIALFAGIFSGLGTGVALNHGTSAGGVDILGAYISVKKDVKIGKYIFLLNAAILIIGGILFKQWVPMLYSVVYFYVTAEVVNVIHKRNNKKLIKIVTNLKEEVSSVLVKNSLHGCTTVKGEGAYTKQERYIIETVVSENEVKNLLSLIYVTDPQAFTTISNVDMVKGRFYIPPMK